AAGIGATVRWSALPAGTDGSYEPTTRRITINPAIAVNQQAAALIHELAHALVRHDHQPTDPALDYATEELVAESVALTVCRSAGLDARANSIPYLAVWRE